MLFSTDRVSRRWRMTQSQMTAYLADRIGISKQAKSALDELNEVSCTCASRTLTDETC